MNEFIDEKLKALKQASEPALSYTKDKLDDLKKAAKPATSYVTEKLEPVKEAVKPVLNTVGEKMKPITYAAKQKMASLGENGQGSQKKKTPFLRKFSKVNLFITLVLCITVFICLLVPSIHFSDWEVLRYRDLTQNDYSVFDLAKIDLSMLFLPIVTLILILGIEVLFVFDHPKLSLFASVPLFFVSIVILELLDGMESAESRVTAAPVIIFICSILFILLAFLTVKRKPKKKKRNPIQEAKQQ